MLKTELIWFIVNDNDENDTIEISRTDVTFSNSIRQLNSLNFIGADVVEVSPPFDLNNITSLVGATIAFEILCTMTKTN